MNDLIVHKGFMRFDRIEEAMKYGQMIASSSFCPRSFMGKPGDVLVAIQMGLELGLAPLQSLQNIAVINGRPSLWGDAMLAVCKTGEDFEYVKEWIDEDEKTAYCEAKRKGEPVQIRSFSEDDAKKARLWGKAGPWTDYPKRMLQMRARSFALRDVFPHLLRGLVAAEEVLDYSKDVKYANTKSKSHYTSGSEYTSHAAHSERVQKQITPEEDAEYDRRISEFKRLVEEESISQENCEAILKKFNIASLEAFYSNKPLVSKMLEQWKKKYGPPPDFGEDDDIDL